MCGWLGSARAITQSHCKLVSNARLAWAGLLQIGCWKRLSFSFVILLAFFLDFNFLFCIYTNTATPQPPLLSNKHMIRNYHNTLPIQNNEAGHLIPKFVPKEKKTESEKPLNKASKATPRYLALLAFAYVVLQQISTSIKWSNGDNFVHKPCRHLKPIDPNHDLSSLSPERIERFKAVQRAVGHAWKGYRNATSLSSFWNRGGGFIPHDDLSPVSERGNSWLHYAATLHDSIDTLYLANMTEHYEEAVHLLTSYDIQTTSIQATKTFEYSLRVLGGLLGAYSLSGDPRLFAAARNAADSILEGPFQASPSIIPRPFNVLAPSTSSFNDCGWLWDWKAAIQRLYRSIYSMARNTFTHEHQTNSLAGFGSFAIEFSFISTVSGDKKYRKIADKIFYHVQSYENNGIVPSSWNVLTGKPSTHGGSLGSGSDSFYEYLIKVPTLNSCYYDAGMEMYTESCENGDKDYLRLYQKMVKESLIPHHVKQQSIFNDKSQNAFPVDNGNTYDHLLCFLPAMLSLGASSKDAISSKSPEDDEYQQLARKLLDGCAAIYKRSKTNLSPDTGAFHSSKFITYDPSYYLRPEYVESLFVIYRTTKDERLQEMAWDVFQSLEKFCKIPNGGYAGLKDVNDPTKGHVDDQPSFFIAETLKYLLLM